MSVAPLSKDVLDRTFTKIYSWEAFLAHEDMATVEVVALKEKKTTVDKDVLFARLEECSSQLEILWLASETRYQRTALIARYMCFEIVICSVVFFIQEVFSFCHRRSVFVCERHTGGLPVHV